LAEKSFLRRQIALAQAAVSRMHQLSSRVTQILDLERPRTTQLWKPAIPLVATFALLCGLSIRQAPELVGFADDTASASTAPAASGVNAAATAISTRPALASSSRSAVAQGMGSQLVIARFNEARFKEAGFKPGSDRQAPVPSGLAKAIKTQPRQQSPAAIQRANASHPSALLLASYSEYVVAHEEFVVTMTSHSLQQGQWQVQVWQLRLLVPASQVEKVTPRKI
jgi:hypothetical protein